METNNNHSLSTIDECRIIELDRHRHENGSLSVVSNNGEFPFSVRRLFYLYDVPGDSERGGHSHHQAQELIVAVSGSFDVTLDDGHHRRTFTLNRPYRALYIPAGIWRGLDNFSSGSVCLVLTSHTFDEADYVRQYDRFLQLTAHKSTRH
ncbi:MAG: FdtA/QdtA family cupin domain-containing protein [Muribaculaceae bacterium]|nr:FdtA/QdtA family cupin domain-containing protein [Muribaculaceae bacterium]